MQQKENKHSLSISFSATSVQGRKRGEFTTISKDRHSHKIIIGKDVTSIRLDPLSKSLSGSIPISSSARLVLASNGRGVYITDR